MGKLLTALDVKILQALLEASPRNFSRVARIVGIPRKMLESRIKRMKSDPNFFLRMYTSVYHTNIGLKKSVVFMEANPGMEQLLFECSKLNGYWLYVCRSYGTGEGCTAIYANPVEHCKEFESFIQEIQHLGVAKNAQIYWSTCFQGGRITSDWFDNQKENWMFPWNDWIEEVRTQRTDLPYTLIEPKSYPICADEIDVRILQKLAGDATRTLSEIARILGISRQRAFYHYKQHLLNSNLIEGYEIFVMRYGNSASVMFYLIVSFHDHEAFAKFTRSLLDKFFVLTMGKVMGENALIVELFFPISEFRNFIDTLSEMAKMGLVKSYRYAIQDLRIRSRQTFSGESFKGNSWTYDHEKHMEMLKRKVSDFLS